MVFVPSPAKGRVRERFTLEVGEAREG